MQTCRPVIGRREEYIFLKGKILFVAADDSEQAPTFEKKLDKSKGKNCTHGGDGSQAEHKNKEAAHKHFLDSLLYQLLIPKYIN